MIPVHEERVGVEDRGTAFAMRVEGLHFAEVVLPPHRAVRVEAVKSARAEEGVDEFAIGYRRVLRRTARVVSAFVRPFFAHVFFPEGAPVAPAQSQDEV